MELWSFLSAGCRELACSLLDAVFPPRCGCPTQLDLPQRAIFGACTSCLQALSRNEGVRCLRCDLPLVGASAPAPRICHECRARPPPFCRLRAPFAYGGVIADLIVAAKFAGRPDLAQALGRLLAADAEVCAVAAGARACVPVPLGRKRRGQRGYNQSAVIAREIGRRLDLEVVHALARTRETRPQSTLSRGERASNVVGAFRAIAKLSGRVVLVDDVVTSGETVREASVALLEAGAQEVMVVAVARSA